MNRSTGSKHLISQGIDWEDNYKEGKRIRRMVRTNWSCWDRHHRRTQLFSSVRTSAAFVFHGRSSATLKEAQTSSDGEAPEDEHEDSVVCGCEQAMRE